MEEGVVSLSLTTGSDEGSIKDIKLANIKTVTEILSSPLFYRFRRIVKGEKVGQRNIL